MVVELGSALNFKIMAVRKTEGRLPEGLSPDDLGQSISSPDGKAILISYIISPLVVNRTNTYVVFVPDLDVAASVESYEWMITEENAAPTTQNTSIGELVYVPQTVSNLTVQVKAMANGNSEVASLSLSQEVVATNAELEELILSAADQPGPGIGNPDVARELVNDHNPYYQNVTLLTPENGDGFKQFVFSMVSDGALQRNPAQRKSMIDQLAASLNNGTDDYTTLISEGAGICKIRMTMLAMVIPDIVTWTELPEDPSARLTADEQLRQTLAAVDENKKIDLFNLVRFPKSNITQCGKILEALRNRYFANANFNDVLTGMSGTRAHWISRHYREGPILTN